ncbi:MAG: BPSS1780 family membrane protein [Propionivibrio sp.]
MQALTLPASQGLRWLSDGFRIFRKKQLLLTLLIIGYWVSMIVISSLPFFGQFAATLLIPVFSVSLMNAYRIVERNATLPPHLLFSGFQQNLRTLLILGVIYFAGTALILGAASLVDGGGLFRMAVLGQSAEESAAGEDSSVAAIVLAIALSLPFMMAYWYAPVLAAWHGLSAGKSLFFSMVACLRNWRAFVVYFLSVVVFGMLLPGLIVAAMTILLPGGGEMMSVALSSLLVVVLMPTLYGSFYASYRDVFVVVDQNA